LFMKSVTDGIFSGQDEDHDEEEDNPADEA
jgi:hypothetical protein